MTKTLLAIAVLALAILAAVVTPTARAAQCLTVTLTGTMGGPPAFNGLAGPGTLVRYGDDDNNCGAVKLQFDAGRGTTMRLSQVGVPVGQLNAVFFTHMHSDHTDGFLDLVQLRWHFDSAGPKLDVVCSFDTISSLGFAISEPPRDSRRLHYLRGWSHEQIDEIFAGGSGAGGSAGL